MGEEKRKLKYENATLEIALLKATDLIQTSYSDDENVADDDWT
jgi:hypothetical protein